MNGGAAVSSNRNSRIFIQGYSLARLVDKDIITRIFTSKVGIARIFTQGYSLARLV